ncbi:MAG: DUF4340 domain-containing protein [Akkermansiaceae bacterium]|nr:DUF4340 domain-containing protein [Akkermansiaceae bacterium]MCF7732476.1 DUF4340 domain-containing protein [Akkermansiaceae bacterium]
MRSLSFTLVLLVTASLLGGVAGWCMFNGDLGALLGVPPTAPGAQLYSTFRPEEVRKIQISTRNANAEFIKTSNGWMATRPWQDRMDPDAAMAIIGFTLGMRVEDSAELDEVPQSESGLSVDQAVAIRLEGEDGGALAKYRIGKRSLWLARSADDSERNPTVFVQPMDKHRKSHVYICAGDIHSVFRNNLGFLRDHHPFFFHPLLLREIRIRSPKGEMTLTRSSTDPKSAWQITKPLELRTDTEAIDSLIKRLGKLAAVTVTDHPTTPASALPATEIQIALAYFNTEAVSVLDVGTPESPTARDVRATVSDRPGTVFSLPLKPERNLVSLADIPTTVNDLRDPTLTHLNPAGLHTVLIQPATGQSIELTREGEKLWTTRIDGAKCKANEVRLYELLTTMTEQRAIGFESDAATDFSPWGLDRPVLKLSFIARDSRSITLRFGLDKHGRLFANRKGTPSVIRLDPSLLTHIAVNPYEWRQARLWSVNRVDLEKIERLVPDEPPLSLKYQFGNESWTAETEGRDVSDQVNAARANYMLGGIENIVVARWLARNDPAATAALEKPSLTLTVTARQVDERGQPTGAFCRTLQLAPPLAPPPGGVPTQTYYGRLEGEPYLFLLDADAYDRLAIDPRDRK